MATIAENLQTIKDSTDAIKQAIINKGGTISGDITTWADSINNLPSGGNNEEYVFQCQKTVSGLNLSYTGQLNMDLPDNYIWYIGIGSSNIDGIFKSGDLAILFPGQSTSCTITYTLTEPENSSWDPACFLVKRDSPEIIPVRLDY